jgi:hypothetical protein
VTNSPSLGELCFLLAGHVRPDGSIAEPDRHDARRILGDLGVAAAAALRGEGMFSASEPPIRGELGTIYTVNPGLESQRVRGRLHAYATDELQALVRDAIDELHRRQAK